MPTLVVGMIGRDWTANVLAVSLRSLRPACGWGRAWKSAAPALTPWAVIGGETPISDLDGNADHPGDRSDGVTVQKAADRTVAATTPCRWFQRLSQSEDRDVATSRRETIDIFVGAAYNHAWRVTTMKPRKLPVLGLAIVFFCFLSAACAAMTIEEAESLSQQSGRPILAVGGRMTCGDTVAVLKSLKEPALSQLASQYVSLYVTEGGADWLDSDKEARQAEGECVGNPLCLRASSRRRGALQPRWPHGERGTPRVVGRQGGDGGKTAFSQGRGRSQKGD